jgi:molybdopterin molybdotransferase
VPRQPGAVYDSNRYTLLAAAREAGCATVSLSIARDSAAEQRAAILRGLEQADVLITSGGVSMGTRDLIKPILAELGEVHFGRIAFKPGKPTTFATVDGKLVFGLPGYPVSSLVSFEVFVRPALRVLQGDARPWRPHALVTLSTPIKPSPDRPEYQRVTLTLEGGRLLAGTTGDQGSSRLISLLGANGLLLVPPGKAVYPAGAQLEAILTGPPLF